MDYTANLEQLAARGAVIFTTNFGLNFIAHRVYEPEIGSRTIRGARRSRDRKERVLEILSPCHGARYKKENGASGKLEVGCFSCGAAPFYETDSFFLSLPKNDGITGVHNLQALMTRLDVNDFIAPLLAEELVRIIEDIWSEFETYTPLREILKREGATERHLL